MARHLSVILRLVFALLIGSTLAACGKPPAGPQTPAQPETSVANEQKPSTLASTDELQTGLGDFDRSTHPGSAVFAQHCASCHTGAVPKAPMFTWLEMMSPATIWATLNGGIMAQQASMLNDQEKLQVVEFLVRQNIPDISAIRMPEPPACSGEAAQFDLDKLPAAVNWGHDTARFSPADVAGFDAADIPGLKLQWAYVYPGSLRARSQPAIALGAVFVGSQDGTVYAFDLKSGCARWTFKASAEVRTAIVLSTAPIDAEHPPLAYFGDILAKFYAVNALTGELVWSIKADDHPGATISGSPLYYQDQLFIPLSSLEIIGATDPAFECCTFRGKILAVNAHTGETIWAHYAIPNPPAESGRTTVGTRILAPSGAPIWSSPTVDVKRNRIYFGTGENYSSPADGNSDAVIAVDISTGERVWTHQSTQGDAWNVACMMQDNPNCPAENGPDHDHGASIILADLGNGKDILLAGHKDGTVYGLDPDNQGAILWQTRIGRGSIQGGIHFGMAAEGTRLYAPINDMNDTHNGDFLDPELARPGMHAIDAATGKVLWSHVQANVCPKELGNCDPGISAAVTAMPGAVFAGHLDGYLRAYEGATGKLLWEVDTTPELTGINGLKGHGGSMSGGAGPAIGDGHVVINSGYGLYNHEPGNLLLVYAPSAD